ncbi:MAG: thioredoxin family protein [Prevotella sp.]|nr:thioredoxin family protein [Prevotella sp.]
MQRLLFIFLFSCLSCLLTIAQVDFSHYVTQTADDEITIFFSGKMSDGWHIYSQNEKNGPTPTTLTISSIKGAEPVGTLSADRKPIKKFEEVFDAEVMYFEKSVIFSQKLKLTGGKYSVEGYLEYGACNDQTCLPPTSVDFSYQGEMSVPAKATEEEVEEKAITNDTGKTIQTIATSDTSIAIPPSSTSDSFDSSESSDSSIPSLWTIFLLGLMGGFIAVLTPCVWPIIPMTVSFFMKRGNHEQGKTGTGRNIKGIRDAVTYGISIIIIYMLLGLVVTSLFGASALNALSTNAFFNIFFFILLLAFGISLLGAFEIVLPASWTNYVNRKSEEISTKSDSSLFALHSSLSIFLMAFTLVLVSFSCTAPIVGFLLVELGTSGNVWGAAIGMLGFAVALALPFMLFALFPAWLKAAPKSGNWMTSVKVTLGAIEIAFSLKFLSVADLAYGWHILDREVFLILWIIIFFLLGCYYLRKAKNIHLTSYILHLTSALVAFAFVAYMIPGLWGAPCKAISAFTPPMSTQNWHQEAKGSIHNPYRDFYEGIDAARKAGRPVMIDFTGYGCVNCRKMEAAVWTDSEVQKIINDEYILIQLYVDDKTSLSQHIKVTENGQQRTLRTIGDKWSYFQRSHFGHNTQPFYVLLDSRQSFTEGEGSYMHAILQKPRSYDEDIAAYIKFLQSGLTAFKNR